MSVTYGNTNPVGHIKQIAATTQGISPYSSSHLTHGVTQADKDEFEKALDETQDVDKTSGWNEANQKQFSLSMFQEAHTRSMEHTRKMKEIYDDLNSSSKNQDHRHR